MKRQTKKRAFTLIELIVVMAVIGILVLLAAPKFLGYTEMAQETKHIHTAKVIETALEAYLINGGAFPDDLEIVDKTLLEESAGKKSLIGVNGYIATIDEETYYELTYEFIQKLDVNLSVKNELFMKASASSAPTAVYASEKGRAVIDKENTIKGFTSIIEATPINPVVPKIRMVTHGDFGGIITDDNQFYTWGNNSQGMLGLGDLTRRDTPTINNFFTQRNITLDKVYVNNSVFAIDAEGKVYSWGYNQFGTAGHGHANIINSPMLINEFSGHQIGEIFFGHYSTFALTKQGELFGWGNNDYGQTGIGYASSFPIKIDIPEKVKQVIPSGTMILAITENNRVFAWGQNKDGRLGVNNYTSVISKPIEILELKSKEIDKFYADSVTFTAILSNGEVYTWGMNDYGQLGLGDVANRIKPIKHDFLSSLKIKNIHKVSLGHASFAVTENGEIYGWGRNDLSHLGSGDKVRRLSPIKIPFFADKPIDKLVAGPASSTFAITRSGEIYGFGTTGESFRFGQGNTVIEYTTPVKLKNLDNVIIKNLYNYSSVSYAETDDGQLYSWGALARLGRTDINSVIPGKVDIPIGITIESLMATSSKTYFIDKEYELYRIQSDVYKEHLAN